MHTKRMIGLIARDLHSIFQTPLIQAVQRELQRRSYRLLAFQGEVSEIVEAHLAEDLVAGWIAINTHDQAEILYQRGTPIILISAISESLPCVLPDNETGIEQAVEHLIHEGRRIGFVTNQINHDFQERHAAYVKALQRHGIEAHPDLLIDVGTYEVEEAYQVFRRQLATMPPFDAIICANDWIAFGVMQALTEAQLRIPEDVAMIGFDDTIEGLFRQPQLSSVRLDPIGIGLTALNMLLEWIEHDRRPVPFTRIATQLVIRQSSTSQSLPSAQYYVSHDHTPQSWCHHISQNLITWLIAPATPDPHHSPEYYWPGIEDLIDSFIGMLAGSTDIQMNEAWWSPFLEHWCKSEHRNTFLDIMRQIGLEYLRQQQEQHGIERLFNWLFACKNSIEHCFLSLVINQAEFDRQRAIAEAHLLSSISTSGQSPRQIAWMEYSYADWAALALWQEPSTSAGTHHLAIRSIYSRQHGTMEANITLSPQNILSQSLIDEPIRSSGDHMLLVIGVISTTRHWGYLITAERFFWSFNNHLRNRVTFLATALELEHQTLELRDLSFRDSLTGLHNRRYLSELFPQKLEQSNRYRRPMAMAVMDLDHLKQINDTYTHAGGDQVLVAIGQLMRENHRAADCCFRLGGEEFAIILPETNAQAARLVCERFRLIIAEHNWNELYPGLRVTMSIGAAMAREGDTIHTLINRADECLYRAKRTGRNRVELLEY
ncbi:MAG: hypothetical protein Fur005_24430 [Roseiflexaceae bacterium]